MEWHKPEIHEIHYAEAKLSRQDGLGASAGLSVSAAQLLSTAAILAGQGNMAPPDKDEKKFWGLRPRKHSLTDTNKGGRPNYGPFVRKLALRFLSIGNYPDRIEDFAEELARWFASHDNPFKDEPKASTIEEHIRDLWQQRHQWPQRRWGIPPR
jgi:hypothetical protein